jgi:hypothetical protein
MKILSGLGLVLLVLGAASTMGRLSYDAIYKRFEAVTVRTLFGSCVGVSSRRSTPSDCLPLAQLPPCDIARAGNDCANPGDAGSGSMVGRAVLRRIDLPKRVRTAHVPALVGTAPSPENPDVKPAK